MTVSFVNALIYHLGAASCDNYIDNLIMFRGRPLQTKQFMGVLVESMINVCFWNYMSDKRVLKC